MRIAVTGAAGFIGKHLSDWLVADGHDVLAIDNLARGKPEHVPPEVPLLKLDLAHVSAAELGREFERFRVEAVVHLAAVHFIPECMRNPERTFAINARSTHTLVEAVGTSTASRVVFASTLDVYAAEDRVHDEADRLAPGNIYGLTKALSEQILESSVRMGACESAVALRLANVYGPNETNPHVIPDAIERIVTRDGPALVMGYLGSARDFVYVKDVARAFGLAATRPSVGFHAANVGTGMGVPVRTVIKMLQDILGDNRPIKENAAAFRKFDRVSLTPSVEAARHLLGWEAQTRLSDGLQATIESIVPALARQAA